LGLLCARLQVELKVKEDEIAQVKAEAMRVNKLREQTLKKIKQLEDSKAEVRGGGTPPTPVCGHVRGHVRPMGAMCVACSGYPA